MSDMQTFTVRDLDRNPKKVLLASEDAGGAIVRSRRGISYLITPIVDREESVGDGKQWLSRHRHWLGHEFAKPIPASQVRKVDQLLAGE